MAGSQRKNAEQVIKNENRVQFTPSFKYVNKKYGILKELTFILARYDILGNFYGFERLHDQIFLCEYNDEEIKRLLKVGTTISNSCSFDLNKLKDQT